MVGIQEQLVAKFHVVHNYVTRPTPEQPGRLFHYHRRGKPGTREHPGHEIVATLPAGFEPLSVGSAPGR